MPRKTKKQKILAKLRRLENQSSTIKEETNSPTEYKLDTNQIIVNEVRSEKIDRSAQLGTLQDYSHVSKDIKKIIILSTIALGFELLLSLTASNSYAKLALQSLGIGF